MDKLYHDKEVIGVSYDKKDKTLYLSVENDNSIVFTNVIQIELNYFSDQNILFDIYKYGYSSIPTDLISDYPFLSSYNGSANNYIYYYICASVGLSGLVICGEDS